MLLESWLLSFSLKPINSFDQKIKWVGSEKLSDWNTVNLDRCRNFKRKN